MGWSSVELSLVWGVVEAGQVLDAQGPPRRSLGRGTRSRLHPAVGTQGGPDLGDGSWLGEIHRGGRAGRKAKPVRVRVIDYTVDNGTPDSDGNDNASGFRLITTVLDPDDIDAADLDAVYWQRWEIETAFDELKTHQRGARGMLQPKSPELIHQELWAMLCCHYAIRTMMADVEVDGGRDPDRVSFIAALRIARDTARQGGLSPERELARLWTTATAILARRLNPKRRARSFPRVVKRKYTKWPVKRATHADWPQPAHLPEVHLTLVS